MRYPQATWRPGPDWKVGYSFQGESGPKRGDVKHSAEGWWDGIHSVLDGPRTASWHFTIGLDRCEQHYPIDAYCWHAGDVDDDGAVAANIDLVGIEHLGVAGQPLTPYQIDMTAKISRWCAEQFGLDAFARYPTQDGVWTLVEHREVSDVPTSCPSGRIPWDRIIVALEAPMPKILTPEEALKFNAQVAFHLNDSRDLGKIATVVQYIFRVRAWPWPAA